MEKIDGTNSNINKLEKEVGLILKKNPRKTVEVTNLLELAYFRLKSILRKDYKIWGIIKEPNYTLHIRKKQNA